MIRLIVGSLGEHVGPGATHTPITVIHATVSPGKRLHLPWPARFNALAYALAGAGTVGVEGDPFEGGQLAVFGAGDAITVTAAPGSAGAAPLEVDLLGGQPIGEPVAQYGPFVMNNRAQLEQALDDYRSGRLGQVPACPCRRCRLLALRIAELRLDRSNGVADVTAAQTPGAADMGAAACRTPRSGHGRGASCGT